MIIISKTLPSLQNGRKDVSPRLLHPSPQPHTQQQAITPPEVVVVQGSAIFKLSSGEYQLLIIGLDALLVLDDFLHTVAGVIGFHVQSNKLFIQSLHQNL